MLSPRRSRRYAGSCPKSNEKLGRYQAALYALLAMTVSEQHVCAYFWLLVLV